MKWLKATKDQLINLDNIISIEKSRSYEISFQHENGSILVKLPNGKIRDEQFEWLITRLSTEKEEAK